MSLKVSRILHAGYLLEQNGTRICFDPIFENPFSINCYAFPSVQFDLEAIRRLELDAVFISHFHEDHCSLESLALLNRRTPIYLFCVHEELFQMIRGLGFAEVHSLDLNIPIQVGEFRVTPRRALDADVDSLFHIEVGDLNILNVVDSWIDPSTLDTLARTPRWDLVLWPFQTMRELEVLSPRWNQAPETEIIPSELSEQLKILKPCLVVPSSCQFKMESWSWYNKAFFPVSYQSFEAAVRNLLPKTQVVRLNPGSSWNISPKGIQPAPPLDWIQILSDTNEDYEFDPSLRPPPTGEIAQRLPAPSTQELNRVLSYCRTDVFQRYQSLPTIESSYFDEPRSWSLRLFHQEGKCLTLNYLVEGQSLKLLGETDSSPDWVTEIPLVKLYGALEKGESLTSIYLRINDFSFPPEKERQLQNADPFEDPLLRCLYEGIFGAYQKAQIS